MIYPGWVHQLITKTVCSQLRHEYVGTYKIVECPLVKLVGAVLEVGCQLCVVASSINLRQVEHVVIVFLRWLHQCIPWYV